MNNWQLGKDEVLSFEHIAIDKLQGKKLLFHAIAKGDVISCPILRFYKSAVII